MGRRGLPDLPASARPALAPSEAPVDPLWQGIQKQLGELLERGDDGLLARWESLLLETTLQRHRYNQVHSADRLGISRHALRTLLKRYDLLPETRAPRNTRVSNRCAGWPPAQAMPRSNRRRNQGSSNVHV